jgi:2-amino-4-hydroxy-6-hydroxymethyldihydropteridine diphosphokinase
LADVFIALGSNLGDRAANLTAARTALAPDPSVTAVSSIYETEPWGLAGQGRYLNQVLRGETTLEPRALLAKLQEIERALGREREREERYGPRTIDLDILLYDDMQVEEPGLTIPHPRMLERAFVLVPLAEVAPGLVAGGVRIGDALARLDRTGVTAWQRGDDGA